MDEDVATGGAWGARGRVWVWVTASLGAKNQRLRQDERICVVEKQNFLRWESVSRLAGLVAREGVV